MAMSIWVRLYNFTLISQLIKITLTLDHVTKLTVVTKITTFEREYNPNDKPNSCMSILLLWIRFSTLQVHCNKSAHSTHWHAFKEVAICTYLHRQYIVVSLMTVYVSCNVFRNNRIKMVAPCRCLDGHVKEPYEMSMALGPDRRSNFFSPPAHQCVVTYMTEISLIVMLNNQFASPYNLNLGHVVT